MEVRVLGSAQDAGVPQVLCACARCARARGDPRLRRLAPGAAVLYGGKVWLLDASPDLRHQLAGLAPAELRGILLTHAHAGHFTGLLQFGREGPDRGPPVHATPRLAAMLRGNEPYATVTRRLGLREHAAGTGFSEEGLTFTALPLRHREELSDTVAWLVEGPRGRLLYMPDTDAFDALALAALGRLSRGDIALVDGTFYAAGEVPGRDMALIPHPRVSESLAGLEPLARRGVRVVFTHLNHTNPLGDAGSPERRGVEAVGFAVAEDGQAWAPGSA